MVRFEVMKRFGYYITESSEHNSEYMPYFIKGRYPELIDRFQIPLDEYPRRCVEQIAKWNEQRDGLIHNKELTHERSREYASYIMVFRQGAAIPGQPLLRGADAVVFQQQENPLMTAASQVHCAQVQRLFVFRQHTVRKGALHNSIQ